MKGLKILKTVHVNGLCVYMASEFMVSLLHLCDIYIYILIITVCYDNDKLLSVPFSRIITRLCFVCMYM